MIRVEIIVRNPFKYTPFKKIWSKAWRVTKHRTLELEIFKYNYNLFEFTVDLQWKGQDHAGPGFDINILGWYFTVSLPDSRHWDYNNNCWEKATSD